MIVSLTDSNFDETVNQPKLTLVDFGAPWCPPCRALEPILMEIAESQRAKATIYSVNVDTEPSLAARFGIRSLPTVLVFKNGKLIQELFGKQPKVTYLEVIAKHFES